MPYAVGPRFQEVTGRQGTAARSPKNGRLRGRPGPAGGKLQTGHRAHEQAAQPPAPLPGTGAALTPVLTERGPRGLSAPRGPSSCPRPETRTATPAPTPTPGKRTPRRGRTPASPCPRQPPPRPAPAPPRAARGPGTSRGHPECDSPHRKFPDGRSNPSRFSLIKPARSRTGERGPAFGGGGRSLSAVAVTSSAVPPASPGTAAAGAPNASAGTAGACGSTGSSRS